MEIYFGKIDLGGNNLYPIYSWTNLSIRLVIFFLCQQFLSRNADGLDVRQVRIGQPPIGEGVGPEQVEVIE